LGIRSHKRRNERIANRKRMLKILREGGPKSYSELVKEMEKSQSTIDRCLQDLGKEKGLGLIDKIEGRWVWVGNDPIGGHWVGDPEGMHWEGSDNVYNTLTDHARNLIPGFKKLLDYGVVFEQKLPHYLGIPLHSKVTDNDRILRECAESHLKAYPTIYEKLEKYRALSDKYKTADKETKKIINMLKGNVHPMYAFKNPKEVGKYHCVMINKDLIREEEDFPLFISKKEADYLAYTSPINEISPIDNAEKVRHLRNRVFRLVKGKPPLFPKTSQGYMDRHPLQELLKIAVSMEEAYRELEQEINQLIMQCRCQPLRTSCTICQNIKK